MLLFSAYLLKFELGLALLKVPAFNPSGFEHVKFPCSSWVCVGFLWSVLFHLTPKTCWLNSLVIVP